MVFGFIQNKNSLSPAIYSPIANWKVDPGNARFLDYSSNGYNPIDDGSSVTEINGFAGQKAIQFQKANGQPVQIAHDIAFQPTEFSICAWTKIYSSFDFSIIAGKYDDRSTDPSVNELREYSIGTYLEGVESVIFNTSQSVIVTARQSDNLILNQWIFASLTVDLCNFLVSVQINDYNPITSDLPFIWITNKNTGLFTIGGTRYVNLNPNPRMIDGAIQQVLFFNQAINRATINYWYNDGNGRF